MTPIKTFTIGSSVFFKDYSDYKSHDIDKLCIMDTFPIKGTNVLNLKKNGEDVFFYRNMNKSEFIKDALESNVSMRVGKFLVPEFAKYLNLTIEDLKLLKPLIDSIDEKHEYEQIIYTAYIENGDFYLTDEQRMNAYELYKKLR